MAGEITFRTAVEADLPAIVRLLADDALGAQRERPDDPLPQAYLDGFAAMSRQPGNEILLAVEADGSIVSRLQLTIIAGVSQIGATKALVQAVRVVGPARGRGIGEALMREAIVRARWPDATRCSSRLTGPGRMPTASTRGSASCRATSA